MKKLLVLCIIVLLLSCFVPDEKGSKGSKGKSGHDGSTTIIEESKQKQIKLIYNGVTKTDWQDIDLTVLQELNFIEVKFFNMENELCICPESLKITYQIDNGDQKTISIVTWQSIVFTADSKTQLKWIGYPVNKRIKIYLIY
jgi:hypothetical protein